jgi:Tfp pilus assembly protein PilF
LHTLETSVTMELFTAFEFAPHLKMRSSSMAKYSLRRISAHEFVKRLKLAEPLDDKDKLHDDKRYAFFLGAGCSFSSGIPVAGCLVRDESAESDWLRRYRDLHDPLVKDEALDQWARTNLRTWSKDSPASSYGELIESLFLTPGERQREIERLCDGKIPNFGYTVLSSLMSRTGGHFSVVLTTNFDDLLVESFFRFQEKRLMVINHDSLASFIRPTNTRPLLVKLHGDHRLSPRNTGAETDSLHELVGDRVATVLHDRGLVFIGYGGNDESILRMLEDLPDEALPFGVYWVSSIEPRGLFRRWLEMRDAVWVAHQGFDELMALIKADFNLEEPSDTHTKKFIQQYQQTQKEMTEKLNATGDSNTESNETAALFITFSAIQLRETDPDSAEKLFKNAIAIAPNNPFVLSNYATFLAQLGRDSETAEASFVLAIDMAPKNASVMGNYALFLNDVRKKHDEAEKYFRRAIEADPKNANILGNFAGFLNAVRKNPDETEEYFRRAIETNLKHANNLGNFAVFLSDVRKDPDEAEKYYRLAIEADPKHVNNLGNFAVFLNDVRKNPDEAEKYYHLAIEADPKQANILGNYAVFLSDVRKNPDEAEKYYRFAIEADPKHVNNLCNYAVFLNRVQKNPDEAEKYHRLAIEADPKSANVLGKFAIFLSDIRRNPDEAEKYHRLAIEADPKKADILNNFAVFLKHARKNPGEEEECYRRAIEADPKHVSSLGNYALLLNNILKNPDEAEKYFRLAIEADTKNPNNLGNFTQFLIISGKTDEGLRLLSEAIQLDSTSPPTALTVELMFYGYAHSPAKTRREYLSQLKILLEKGVRSNDWDFTRNVEVATKVEKHTAKGWLAKLASVCSGKADIKALHDWKVWREA